MLTLRPYQREAVEAVYRHLRERDDNPCVVIPTGGGKTPVMATVCDDAVTRWNGRVLVLAHVKELIEQTAGTLDRMAPHLHVGLYSAGLGRRDTEHPCLVAGIQSVYKRAAELEAFDLVIIDEAHMIPPEGDGMYQTFLADAKVVNPNVRVIGLTATPFRMTSGMICRPDHFLNHVCYEVGVKELIVGGYLAPLRTKAGVVKADTSGLHVRGGEFVAGEVEDLMDSGDLVRSACAEIVELTRERQSVLIFASGIRHGQHVVEILHREHGLECGFVTGDTPTAERFGTLDLLVVQGLFSSPLSQRAEYELPSAAFAERDGSYVNRGDRLQSARPAIRPPGSVRTEGSVFWELLKREGLYNARAVVDEVAREVSYFSAAAGPIPEVGIDMKVNLLA